MKILELLISFRPGGAERVAVELSLGLKQRGAEADICSLIDQGFLRESEGIKTFSFGLKDPRLFHLILRKLSALAENYDLCISYCTYADYALALSRTKKPRVLTIRSVDFNRWRVPGWAYLDRWLYGRADALVAVSQLHISAHLHLNHSTTLALLFIICILKNWFARVDVLFRTLQ